MFGFILILINLLLSHMMSPVYGIGAVLSDGLSDGFKQPIGFAPKPE